MVGMLAKTPRLVGDDAGLVQKLRKFLLGSQYPLADVLVEFFFSSLERKGGKRERKKGKGEHTKAAKA